MYNGQIIHKNKMLELSKSNNNLLLNRTGSKQRIAPLLLQNFPSHDCFIDMFFGFGGLFFNKPKAKYNVCNDADGEVINFFNIIKLEESRNEFLTLFRLFPRHKDISLEWASRKNWDGMDAMTRAIRFAWLCIYTYRSGLFVSNGDANRSKIFTERLNKIGDFLEDIVFFQCDFRELLQKISWSNETGKQRYFIYADPPYVETICLSYRCKWSADDTADLFEVLVKSGLKFGISELDKPIIRELTAKHNLRMLPIKNIQNNNSNGYGDKRMAEVLVVNYDVVGGLF